VAEHRVVRLPACPDSRQDAQDDRGAVAQRVERSGPCGELAGPSSPADAASNDRKAGRIRSAARDAGTCLITSASRSRAVLADLAVMENQRGDACSMSQELANASSRSPGCSDDSSTCFLAL